MRFGCVVRVAEIEFFLSQRPKSLRPSLESLGYLESFVAEISTFGYLEYFVTTRNTPRTKYKSSFREAGQGLKQTVGKGIIALLSLLSTQFFVTFCFFQPESFSLAGYAQNHFSTFQTLWA